MLCGYIVWLYYGYNLKMSAYVLNTSAESSGIFHNVSDCYAIFKTIAQLSSKVYKWSNTKAALLLTTVFG